MKKLTLFRGRAMACLIFMCLFLAQGCRKDLLQSNSPVLKSSLSVDEARAYFDKNLRKQVRSKVVMGTGPITSSSDAQDIVNGKQPMWGASILKDLSIKTNAVLTPLHKEGVSVHVSDKKMVKFGFLNYMMMYKNEKDSIITEWVELKPSKNWINSKVSRKYEGRILVRDWDGNIKRVIDFGEDHPDKVSTIGVGAKKLSAMKGAVMTGGDQVCFWKTTYTITSGASTCSCKGHTYAQWAAGGCTCGDVPRQGYTTTITYETTVDCINIEPDEPIGPGGGTPPSGGGGTNPYPGYGGGGGGPNPGDYNPIQCNPNPVDPSVPPPPGQEYAIPCSEILIPDEDIPGNNNPTTPLTTTELLVHYFNADPDADMHLTAGEVTFLNGNADVVEELRNYLEAETPETKKIGRWEIEYLSGSAGGNEDYVFTLINVVEPNIIIDPAILRIYFSFQCAIIRTEHHDYPEWRVKWEASQEMLHLALDGIGFVPGIGEVADLTNGAIYAIQGDGVNATLSVTSAIPFVGWFSMGAKYAKKTINLANGSKTTLKWVRKAGNFVNFGDRAQLRKVLNLVPRDLRQAHHIIPWGKQAHPAIQKAAKANGTNPFHMNDALNGIPLNNSVHLGSHAHYDNLVEGYLNAIPSNATPEQAYDAVTTLIDRIRTAINNNPGVHINQLNF